jgi:hypothetical protein
VRSVILGKIAESPRHSLAKRCSSLASWSLASKDCNSEVASSGCWIALLGQVTRQRYMASSDDAHWAIKLLSSLGDSINATRARSVFKVTGGDLMGTYFSRPWGNPFSNKRFYKPAEVLTVAAAKYGGLDAFRERVKTCDRVREVRARNGATRRESRRAALAEAISFFGTELPPSLIQPLIDSYVERNQGEMSIIVANMRKVQKKQKEVQSISAQDPNHQEGAAHYCAGVIARFISGYATWEAFYTQLHVTIRCNSHLVRPRNRSDIQQAV